MSRPDFEAWLQTRLHTLPESTVRQAMEYALLAGGKRLRPRLLFAALESYGQEPAMGYPFAGGLEMVHTYSLVHDDLPAMDDDDLRRGRPTLHKAFGEAQAILAGDGLLTLGLQEAAGQGPEYVQLLAELAGAGGMIYGQELDLKGEEMALPTVLDLIAIDRYKTGCLLEAPLRAAALLSGHPEDEEAMKALAFALGIAFQIQDDILDVTSTPEIMGKSLSDAGANKATFVRLLGLEGAKDEVARRKEAVLGELDKLHLEDPGPLKSLVEEIFTREN